MNCFYPFINTPLPYSYDALMPFIDETTMHLHHDRHLQTYIDNLNALIEANPCLAHYSLEELLRNLCGLPAALQLPVRNQAGGVYNHRFFFDGMERPGQSSPDAELIKALNRQFHDFNTFQSLFKEAALSVFGSGYAWLVLERGRLRITVTPNQDTPLECCQYPLLNLDVWEHAYYLKHYNLRAAYVDEWFCVVNWNMVSRRFQAGHGRRRGCCEVPFRGMGHMI